MIQDEAELAVVQKQLGRAERALEDLRQSVKNARTLEVLSEGYVDTIAELKAEIDDYQRTMAKTNGAVKKDRGEREKV
jgi:hypothetical protein